ncbi:MAG: hypothetical protein Q8L48_42515 [Archangium sp.]|nr:hypothetical protein [Archangium sp.]
MDYLPDVLDHLGKTPREFGALHAHFESVTTVDGTRVVARVLYQGAFSPLPPGAQIAFHAASAGGAQGEQLGCFDVPALAESVMRVSYPLRVPVGSTHVVAFLNAPPPSARADRVRPAWKLHDTVEIPKLSEMAPVSETRADFNLARTLLGTAMMGGVGFVVSFSSTTTLAANNKTTVHKARELPPGLVQAISPEVTSPIDGMVEDTLWRPGQPLPAPPEITYKPIAQSASAKRWCRSCGF